MAPADDRSIETATRLARLLADTRGAEALAELQKLSKARWAPDRAQAGPGAGAARDSGSLVGVWEPEPVPAGIALRRRDGLPEWWLWADIDYVPPPAGARRLALLGESAARGWLLDPAFNPATALSRCLAGGPAQYQVVDLARTNIDLETLEQVVANLSAIEPDVVVVFAGNNFTFAPLEDSYRDQLAEALRAGGYQEMRRVYIESIVIPRVDHFLDRLAGIRRDLGAEIVIVVPETNLLGWVAAAEIEIPAMPAGAAEKWYQLRGEAEAALAGRRWEDVRTAAAEMRSLDGGLSPLPWYLEAQGAIATGNGREARRLLEGSRDAAVGLLLDLVPYVITPVRQRLLEFAGRSGMPCVDLADALRSADLPELPDPRCFLDHIHLTDEGIERVFSRVADAVLGQPPGTTPPGPGAGPAPRALGHALGAGYAALHNQPPAVVRRQLELARAADSKAADQFVGAFLDVLESPAIRWTHPELGGLLANRQTYQLSLNVARARGHSPGFWTFRDVAHDVLGRAPQALHDGWRNADLLRSADARGFRAFNFAPGKAYFEATTKRSAFCIALRAPRSAALRLTYRLPEGEGSATVELNGALLGKLTPARDWATTVIDVPAAFTVTGVNWIQIEWPAPGTGDSAMRESDASALARRAFPRVLPVFGALFSASFETPEQGPRKDQDGPAPRFASRTDASTAWQPVRGRS